MKILFICNKSPWPPKEGGSIAMNTLIEGMIQQGHSVKVLAINTNKYFTDLDDVPSVYKNKTQLELGYIDLSIKPIPSFLNLFSDKSYHVQRFINKDLDKRIIRILSEETYDVIQLETLFMCPYIETIRKHSKGKIILRAHNIEHLIWERIANASSNPIKKYYIGHLAKTLKKYELEILEKLNGIAAITKKDSDFFKAHTSTPCIDIPFGVDINNYQQEKVPNSEIRLFHIGSMNWIPNSEGMKWFLENVWSSVHNNHPNLKFVLAGREMPVWLLEHNYPNVQVVGEVDDAMDFINENSIMIVPLLSGSGIRIKIIEAMTASKTVISTSIGAEGINITNGKDILIADNEKEFISNIKLLIENQEKIDIIGNNARKLIETDHSNEVLMKKLERFYSEV